MDSDNFDDVPFEENDFRGKRILSKQDHVNIVPITFMEQNRMNQSLMERSRAPSNMKVDDGDKS